MFTPSAGAVCGGSGGDVMGLGLVFDSTDVSAGLEAGALMGSKVSRRDVVLEMRSLSC